MKIKLRDISNVAIIILTIATWGLMALKLPAWGFAVGLLDQVFWTHISWVALRKNNEWGIFVTNTFITLTMIYGAINYWVF